MAQSEEEVAKATEIVNKAFKAGGAATSEQIAGILQLSQALGSGILQGDELRSLRENAPLLAKAIADEFGVTIAGLKDLGAEGKLTTDRVFKAILNAQPQIEAAFNTTNQTIADGMTRVNNAFTQYIGQSDSSLSASERLIVGLNALADNFDETADVVLKVAGVIAGALVGRSIGLMVAKLGLAASVVGRFVAALRAAATVGGLATAIGGVSAAAGPLGLVIGGTVVGALALFSSSSDAAGDGAERFTRRLERMGEAATQAAQKTEQAGGKVNEVLVNKLTGEVDAATVKVGEATASVMDLFDALFANVDRNTISPEQLRQLEELRDKLKAGEVSAEDANQALHALANSNPNFQAVANAFKPLLDNLALVIAGAKAARDELTAASGAQLSPQQIAGYRQYGQSRQQGEEMLRIGKAYADEAARQNSLSKEQLAIEKEIATIKKDVAAKGGFLNDADIRALAERNVAAGERRSKEGRKTPAPKKTSDDRFSEDIQAIRDRTAALIQEQQIVGKSYFEQERRRMALDLEQQALRDVREEARRKGDADWRNAQLTPDHVAKINAVSEAYAKQADILRVLDEKQQITERSAQEFYDTAKSGFVDVIKGTTSLSEALSNLASKLADLALNSAFDGLFGGSSATGSGGWLTGIFKGLGFASGGYTGPGGKNTPAGIVHKGEVVFSQADVARMGGVAAVEALRRGYANGGPVAMRAPTMPRLASQGGGGMSVSVDARTTFQASGNRETDNEMMRALARRDAEMPALILKTVRDAQQRRGI